MNFFLNFSGFFAKQELYSAIFLFIEKLQQQKKWRSDGMLYRPGEYYSF